MKTRDADGTVHYSTLKRIGRSPRHYQHGVNATYEANRAMLVGVGVHHLLFGDRPGTKTVRFSGDRRAKEWKAFLESHTSDPTTKTTILTAHEWDDAQDIASAVRRDPVAQEMLDGGRFEVPLKWNDGVERSTGGVDIIGTYDGVPCLVDLKTTTNTDPTPLMRQAWNMSYHCQLADYANACKANGIDVQRCYLLCVEVEPPHVVTALEVDAALLEHGRRTVATWVERFKVCEETNQWPGYAQAPVLWTLPTWLQAVEDEEADGDG